MSTSRGQRRSGFVRGLPLVYLGIAMALAVVVLPSILRPPPEQQQSSAALNPNAPPDDEAETIIQSLKQAASRTAGASGSSEAVAATTTTTTVIRKASRGCFGDPPRQTESAYSPPCRAAFTGDNGGSTYKNVTGEEITVSYWHVLGMPAHRGKISDTPPPDEDGAYRTARVLQRYFNDRYEMYGRRLQLWAIEDNGDADADQRTSAVKQATQSKAFIATHLSYPFCDEFTRQGLICFNGNGFQKQVYEDHSPLWWSYQMDTDTVDQLAAEYICKKLINRNADFAGDSIKGQPRTVAVLTESTPNNHFRTAKHVAQLTKEICDFEPPLVIDFDPGKPEQVASTIAQLRSAGATTVVPAVGLIGIFELFSAADSSGYEPEWVFVNNYGMDFNDSARLTPATQMRHVFGLGGWELPQPFEDTDCYRAYKSVDPTTAPDANFCRLHWIDLEHIANGIQEAGPNLTPESFEKGLYSMQQLREPSRPYAIGGGYGPGDHSFVDDLVELWWDSGATDPDGGEPSAYRFPQEGKRFRPGELDDIVRVFADGVRGYGYA